MWEKKEVGAYDFLDVIYEVGKCNERKLSFEMGILAQMASRVTGGAQISTTVRFKRNQRYLFSALKLSCTQNTSPKLGKHVSK